MADTKISGLSSASAVADTDIIPIVSGGVNYKATRASLFTGTVTLLTNGAANKGLIVKGASSQSGNLIEYQDNLGNTLGAVTSSANLLVSQVSALTPASGAGNSITISGSTAVSGNNNGGDTVVQLVSGSGSGAAGNFVIKDTGGTTRYTFSSGTFTILTAGGQTLYGFDGTTHTFGQNGAAGQLGIQTSNSGNRVAFTTGGSAGFQFSKDITVTTGGYWLNFDTTVTRASASVVKLTAGVSGLGALICGQPTTGTVGLTVQAITSATANLQEWQNSSGTVLTSVAANGAVNIFSAASSQGFNVYGVYVSSSQYERGYVRSDASGLYIGHEYAGAQASRSIYFQVAGLSPVVLSSSGNLSVQPLSAGTVGLIVKGAASQSANIQEWQNSSGVVKLSANFNGTSAHGRLVIATGGYSDNGLIITSDAATGGGSASGTISYSTSNYFTFSKPIGYTIAIEMSSGRQWINNNTSSGITFESQATATGQVAYIFTTQNSLSTSSLLSFRNSGTEVVGVASSGAVTITSASASSFVVGANGTTNPVFRVVGNVSSAATGLSVTGNAAGSGVTLTALSSGTNEYISLNPKGTSYTIFSGSAAISASGSTSFFGGGWWNGSNLTALSNDPSTIEFSNQTIIFRITGGVTAGTTYSGSIPLTINNSLGVSVTTTLFANSTVGLASSSVLRFSSDSNGHGTADLSLTRNSASILKIGNAGSGLGAVICGQPTTSIIGLTVKQATSGTANLQEWQNSSGTALATVTKDGYLTTPQISSGGTTPLVITSHSTTLTTDSDGATITFNLATSNDHLVVLGGNRTLALSNDQTGQKFSIILQQDATGSRTVTWWSGISWSGGSAPTLTTTANKNDVFTFWKIGVGSYLGFITGQNL